MKDKMICQFGKSRENITFAIIIIFQFMHFRYSSGRLVCPSKARIKYEDNNILEFFSWLRDTTANELLNQCRRKNSIFPVFNTTNAAKLQSIVKNHNDEESILFLDVRHSPFNEPTRSDGTKVTTSGPIPLINIDSCEQLAMDLNADIRNGMFGLGWIPCEKYVKAVSVCETKLNISVEYVCDASRSLTLNWLPNAYYSSLLHDRVSIKVVVTDDQCRKTLMSYRIDVRAKAPILTSVKDARGYINDEGLCRIQWKHEKKKKDEKFEIVYGRDTLAIRNEVEYEPNHYEITIDPEIFTNQLPFEISSIVVASNCKKSAKTIIAGDCFSIVNQRNFFKYLVIAVGALLVVIMSCCLTNCKRSKLCKRGYGDYEYKNPISQVPSLVIAPNMLPTYAPRSMAGALPLLGDPQFAERMPENGTMPPSQISEKTINNPPPMWNLQQMASSLYGYLTGEKIPNNYPEKSNPQRPTLPSHSLQQQQPLPNPSFHQHHTLPGHSFQPSSALSSQGTHQNVSPLRFWAVKKKAQSNPKVTAPSQQFPVSEISKNVYENAESQGNEEKSVYTTNESYIYEI